MFVAGNQFRVDGVDYYNNLKLRMYNSVVTGNLLNELALDSGLSHAAMDYHFENCAFTLDTKYNPPTNKFFNIIKNVDYKFMGPTWNDYRLREGSPLINRGLLEAAQSNPQTWFDLEGKNRLTDGMPDIGAFEK